MSKLPFLIFPISFILFTNKLFAANTAFAVEAQTLLREKACLSCHAVEKKLIGPAYKEVAAKHRALKDAEGYLSTKIKNGSIDVWGQIPMPPNTSVTDDEARVLAKYILSVK